MRPSPGELLQLAASHWAASYSLGPDAAVALGWYARNLFVRARLSAGECCVYMVALAGDFPEAMFERRLAGGGIRASVELLRAIWAGEHADPTEGAVRAHRHDESPVWAERARPTALIGPWVFYRAR